MAYFKVLIKEEYVYEVLVRADDVVDATSKAMKYEDGWGDSISRIEQVYEVTELEAKTKWENSDE